jgi:hypothetical protein
VPLKIVIEQLAAYVLFKAGTKDLSLEILRISWKGLSLEKLELKSSRIDQQGPASGKPGDVPMGTMGTMQHSIALCDRDVPMQNYGSAA